MFNMKLSMPCSPRKKNMKLGLVLDLIGDWSTTNSGPSSSSASTYHDTSSRLLKLAAESFRDIEQDDPHDSSYRALTNLMYPNSKYSPSSPKRPSTYSDANYGTSSRSASDTSMRASSKSSWETFATSQKSSDVSSQTSFDVSSQTSQKSSDVSSQTSFDVSSQTSSGQNDTKTTPTRKRYKEKKRSSPKKLTKRRRHPHKTIPKKMHHPKLRSKAYLSQNDDDTRSIEVVPILNLIPNVNYSDARVRTPKPPVFTHKTREGSLILANQSAVRFKKTSFQWDNNVYSNFYAPKKTVSNPPKTKKIDAKPKSRKRITPFKSRKRCSVRRTCRKYTSKIKLK